MPQTLARWEPLPTHGSATRLTIFLKAPRPPAEAHSCVLPAGAHGPLSRPEAPAFFPARGILASWPVQPELFCRVLLLATLAQLAAPTKILGRIGSARLNGVLWSRSYLPFRSFPRKRQRAASGTSPQRPSLVATEGGSSAFHCLPVGNQRYDQIARPRRRS